MRYVTCLLLLLVLIPNMALAKMPVEGFADLAEKLSPAVVNISTSKTIKGNVLGGGMLFHNLPEGHPFEKFNKFFEEFGGGESNKEQKATSLGSGFIIDPEGYIATNNHVIDGAEEIEVNFGNDDTKYKATVIGADKKTDLALLKIERDEPFPFVTLGDSSKSRVGDWIVVIGNPFGLGGSVSAGIISARGRDINAGPFDDFIQTDAAINRGNSGGPMFNMDGEVIGINTAIFSPGGVGNVGIGFAVPTSLAKPIFDQLRETGSIKRGWLGVKIQHVTDEIAESLGLDRARGALVAEVMDDSPAKEAGIEVGDIIISFDGKEVNQMKRLPRIVAETKVGKNVDVIVLRDGEERNLKVEVARLSEDQAEDEPEITINKSDAEEAKEELGMKLLAIDEKVRASYNLDDEVNGLLVVDITSDSYALERGIRKGDIIIEANQKKLTSLDVLHDVVEKAKDKKRKAVLLLVSRNKETLFVAVPVED